MSLDLIANTSLPADYMENNSIPSSAFEIFLTSPVSQPPPVCLADGHHRISRGWRPSSNFTWPSTYRRWWTTHGHQPQDISVALPPTSI